MNSTTGRQNSVSAEVRSRSNDVFSQGMDRSRSNGNSSRVSQIDPTPRSNSLTSRPDFRSSTQSGSTDNRLSSGSRGNVTGNTNSTLSRQAFTAPNTSRSFYGPSSRGGVSDNANRRSGNDSNGRSDWNGRSYYSGNDRGDWGSNRNGYRYGGNYPSRSSFYGGFGSPFSSYGLPRYGYGYGGYGYGSGYRSYYPYRSGYPFGYSYGYPWGVVASRLLFGLPYLAYSPLYRYGGYRGYSYYGGYGSYYDSPSVGYISYAYQPTTIANHVVVPEPAVIVEPQAVEAEPQLEKPEAAAVANFAAQGEADFRAGKYDDAIRKWQHSLVDDPGNGAMVMLLGQALFAAGQYDEAAGAIQHAMELVPAEKWDVVVKNRAELYGNNRSFSDQLKALEAARDTNDSPAVRFLLGYEYGFSGSPQRAITELDKTLEMAPQDETAKKLRDLLSAKKPVAPEDDLIIPPAPANE